MANAVSVSGLRELERAFRRADKALADDLQDALKEAAAPVQRDAQTLAASQIRNVKPGDPWAGMKIGSGRSIVWVAPLERATRVRARSRGADTGPPSFADLLADRAMEPAAERNRTVVEHRLDRMLDEVANVWERG